MSKEIKKSTSIESKTDEANIEVTNLTGFNETKEENKTIETNIQENIETEFPPKCQQTCENKESQDSESTPLSPKTQSILKQTEFYFSDSNLPKDKFMWKTTCANNGWVPIHVISGFKRMRGFVGENNDLTDIKNALKQSKVIEVDADVERVRRIAPLIPPDEKNHNEINARSVYAKGFLPEDREPKKEGETPNPLTKEEEITLQIEIERYFENIGKVIQVRLRRRPEKQNRFKGSVFVEFAKLEDATAFLSTKREWEGRELKTMSKLAYIDMKRAEHGFTDGAKGKRMFRKFNGFRDGKRFRTGEPNNNIKRNRANPRKGHNTVKSTKNNLDKDDE